MFKTTVIVIAAIGTLSAPAFATPKRSFAEAVDVCTDRAVKFGNSTFGKAADFPQPDMVQQRYRACVFANSGKYPKAPVQYRKSVLRDLGILK